MQLIKPPEIWLGLKAAFRNTQKAGELQLAKRVAYVYGVLLDSAEAQTCFCLALLH